MFGPSDSWSMRQSTQWTSILLKIVRFQSTQLSRETRPKIDWNQDGQIEFYNIMSFLGTSISSLVSICLWAVVSAAVAATSQLFCQCSAQLRELQTSMPPRQGKTLKTFLCMLTKRVGLVKKDEKTSLTVHFKFQFSIALLLLRISCPCCQHDQQHLVRPLHFFSFLVNAYAYWLVLPSCRSYLSLKCLNLC